MLKAETLEELLSPGEMNDHEDFLNQREPDRRSFFKFVIHVDVESTSLKTAYDDLVRLMKSKLEDSPGWWTSTSEVFAPNGDVISEEVYKMLIRGQYP